MRQRSNIYCHKQTYLQEGWYKFTRRASEANSGALRLGVTSLLGTGRCGTLAIWQRYCFRVERLAVGSWVYGNTVALESIPDLRDGWFGQLHVFQILKEYGTGYIDKKQLIKCPWPCCIMTDRNIPWHGANKNTTTWYTFISQLSIAKINKSSARKTTLTIKKNLTRCGCTWAKLHQKNFEGNSFIHDEGTSTRWLQSK